MHLSSQQFGIFTKNLEVEKNCGRVVWSYMTTLYYNTPLIFHVHNLKVVFHAKLFTNDSFQGQKACNQVKHCNKTQVSNVLSLTEMAILDFENASHIPHSFTSENV